MWLFLTSCKMSEHASSSNAGRRKPWMGRLKCNCHRDALLMTSNTEANPGRRFFGCPGYFVCLLPYLIFIYDKYSMQLCGPFYVHHAFCSWQDDDRNMCSFFEWLDPPLPSWDKFYRNKLQKQVWELKRENNNLMKENQELKDAVTKKESEHRKCSVFRYICYVAVICIALWVNVWCDFMKLCGDYVSLYTVPDI